MFGGEPQVLYNERVFTDGRTKLPEMLVYFMYLCVFEE